MSQGTERGIGEGEGEIDEQVDAERRYALSATAAFGCRYTAGQNQPQIPIICPTSECNTKLLVMQSYNDAYLESPAVIFCLSILKREPR